MKIDIIERTVISAEEGMVLTDGECYGKVFVLAKDRTTDEFSEISDAEYEEILSEQESLNNSGYKES